MTGHVSEPLNIEALRAVLERDPASALFYELAQACCEVERWEEAEGVLRAGLRLRPEHLEARVLLGLALVRRGRLEEARSEFAAVAQALGSLCGRVYPQLSALCEEARDIGQALEWLRLAEAHGPLPEGEGGQGGRKERLEALLQEERRRQVMAEAKTFLRQGQAEAAVSLLSEALREAPGDPALREGLEEAGEQVAHAREAKQVIGLLQGWLHNIRDIKD